MRRSSHPEAVVREAVAYYAPESDGVHTYIWPYGAQRSGNIGILSKGLQVDVNPNANPPYVAVIHIDNMPVTGQDIRDADSSEAARMADLIEEDYGPDADGLNALRAFVTEQASKQ